jgi:hypothetical protein
LIYDNSTLFSHFYQAGTVERLGTDMGSLLPFKTTSRLAIKCFHYLRTLPEVPHWHLNSHIVVGVYSIYVHSDPAALKMLQTWERLEDSVAELWRYFAGTQSVVVGTVQPRVQTLSYLLEAGRRQPLVKEAVWLCSGSDQLWQLLQETYPDAFQQLDFGQLYQELVDAPRSNVDTELVYRRFSCYCPIQRQVIMINPPSYDGDCPRWRP